MTAKPLDQEKVVRQDGERLAIMEVQLSRMVSDMESEKRTRAESNRTINEHLVRQDDKIDKISSLVARGIGIFIALQVIIPLAIAIWLKN